MFSTYFGQRLAFGLFCVALLLPYEVSGSPVFLTPLLESNNISTARELSTVKKNTFASFNVELPSSNAGYITVNKSLDNHMFFWLFRAKGEKNTPLLLWLNGGPAYSSMIGLFSEHGPVQCSKKDGKSVVKENPHSWTQFASVLYVDNPVGTGFSYSDSGDDNQTVMQDDITNELFSFLEQFFRIFPEFKYNDFFIGGQSYAGKYVPHLAHHIHKKRENGYTNIPLTGVYLGAPLFDPITQFPVSYDYLYSVGRVSLHSYNKNKQFWNKLISQNGDGNSEWTIDYVLSNFVAVENITFNRYAGKDLDNSCIEEVLEPNHVRKAIHAGFRNFTIYGSLKFMDKFMGELFKSTKAELAVLMDNYKVLVYNGDNDVLVSPSMTEAALMSTPWSKQSEFNETERSVWLSRDGRYVKGYYSKTYKFCRVVVRGAGHNTPHDQPIRSLQMMKRFVNKECV